MGGPLASPLGWFGDIGLAWGPTAFVALDAVLFAVFFVRRLGRCAASWRRRREERYLEKLELRVGARFPEVERVAASTNAVASTASATSQLAAAAETLSSVFQRAGKELQAGFADASLSKDKDVDKDCKTVGELLVAWREVGEASAAFSRQMLELSGSLKGKVSEVGGERSRLLAEVRRLQEAYVSAEATSHSWREQFLGRPPVPSHEKKSPRHEHFESQLADIAQAFSQLSERSEAVQQKCSAALAAGEAETRRLAQAVGERLVQLRPSWRGSNSREAPVRAPRAGGGGQLVGGLVKSMTTAAGRQRLREAEAAEEAKAAVESPQEVPQGPVLSPHAERLDGGGWKLCGHYEHQVLKIGLRILDRDWSCDGLFDFPQGLFRAGHIKDLLAGTLRLQSMLGNDIAAAQRDMHKLTLRQLLRLRVWHLDFVPSGCGSNTVTGVGDTHEALLSLVDRLLFQGLGRRAVADMAPGGSLADSDAHRLGREAALHVAAAAAVIEPRWWVWWLTEENRVFFDPVDFTSAAAFPAGGVLEVADHSKRDKHEPTGRLRFLEWRINVVASEDGLSATQPRESPREPVSSTDGGACGTEQAKEVGLATGAATAGMVSVEMLQGLRSSLRRTGNAIDRSP